MPPDVVRAMYKNVEADIPAAPRTTALKDMLRSV